MQAARKKAARMNETRELLSRSIAYSALSLHKRSHRKSSGAPRLSRCASQVEMSHKAK
jgi:hypothetical protein